jgi:hypothetical protein
VRAEELLDEMRKNNKYFYLGVFSSAETIKAVGVEFMAKLGIDFVWIGVESKRSIFTKTKGVDLKSMIKQLRDYGIQVLGSAILFLDHHTKENMQEDIDFIIDMQTDFVQFMNLGPLPGTALYQEFEAAGKLRMDIPYQEWHGQDKIWFTHDHFSVEESSWYLKDAFEQDYRRQGPSLLRLAETALRGYRTMRSHSDPRIRGLTPRLKERCVAFRPLLPAARRHAVNDKTVEMIDYLEREFIKEFGPCSPADRLLAQAARVFAAIEAGRIATGKHMTQPPFQRRRYRLSPLSELAQDCQRLLVPQEKFAPASH